MDYSAVLTKNKQYNQIINDISNGVANHAYLLKTADTLFSEFICFSIASKLTASTIGRISKKIHPDVFIYGENGKIDVSQVNEIISNINVTPYEANKKVYILLDIQNMNETSQNKILKSIEEPPKDVIFIMTCSNTKTLLSTILSRVKLLEIDSINNDDITELLIKEGSKPNEAQVAVSCSGGNSTLAQKLTTKEFTLLYSNVLSMLANLNSSRICLEFAQKFDNKNIDKAEIIDITILLVRDISMILSGNDNLVTNKHIIADLKQIASGFNLAATSKIIQECLLLKEDLYYNTNTTAVLDKFLFKIAEEKSKCKKL